VRSESTDTSLPLQSFYFISTSDGKPQTNEPNG